MFTQWHYEASWDDVFHELPVLDDDDEVFHRIGNQDRY